MRWKTRWTSEQHEEFLKALTALSEIYGRELSKMAMKLYADVLGKYPFEAVMRAITAYLENARGNGQFFPKPADIVALIEGNPDDRATKAWLEVKEALARVGTYSSVKFRDPIINACIRELGGWTKLGEMTEDRLEFVGNEFKKLYRHFYQTGRVPEVKHLPGRVELENRGKGFPDLISDPVVLGTPLPSHARITLRAPEDELKPIPQVKRTIESLPQGVS